MIELLVVEDHPVTIDGLKCIFENDDEILIKYDFNNIDGALKSNDDFDLILLDLFLQETNPLDNIERLKQVFPDKPIVIFTCEDSIVWKRKTFEAGAIAYVIKTYDKNEIIKTLKYVINITKIRNESSNGINLCNLSFFNFLEDLFLIIDFDGKILELNASAINKLGYVVEDNIHINDIFPFINLDDLLIKYQFDSDKLQALTKNKSKLYLKIKSMRLHTKCTGNEYIMLVAKDIELEEKYRNIFNNSVQGVFQSTIEGKYLTANPAFIKMLEYDNLDDLKNSIEDIRTQIYDNPEDRDNFKKLLFENSFVSGLEGQMIKKNGEKIWVSCAANLVKDDKGDALYIDGIVENITDKKESFNNYRSLLNALPDMIARVSSDGHIIDIKPGLGIYSESGQSTHYIATNIKNLPFGEEITNNFMNIIRVAIDKNEPIEYNYSIKISGEDRHYYSRTVKNDRDEVIVIVRDTTKETNISRELRDSKEFAENLINTANVMIVGLDNNGNVKIFNRTAEVLTGYKKDEVLNKNWFTDLNIILKKDSDRLNNIFKGLIENDGEKANEVENSIITKHGEIKYILWQNNEIRENNKAVGTISFGLDISERRKFEDELMAAMEKSEKNEKKYKNLVDTLQEGIWVIDENSKTIFINNRMSEMLGYNSDEMMGKRIFDFMDEDGVKKAEYNVDRRKQGIMEQHDFEFIRKNGEKIYTTLETGPLTDEKGNYIGAIAGVIDITERKKMENELIDAKNKAEQSDKMKLEFLANMSHDLRTPMNSIIGFSDLLKANNLSKHERNDYLNTIISNGKFLMALIDDIIDISKIDAGNLSIENNEFEINKLMEELRLSYYKQMKDKNIEIIIDVDVNKNIIINTDKYRLRQVLMNLIGNAIKFTNDGYVKFGYRIINNRLLEVYVEDTGRGIERQYQKVIFDRFKQIGNNNKFKGAGLGLSIAKSLIELLGFKEIKLISELDKGSKFYFYVPYFDKHYNYINEIKMNKKHKKINFAGKNILIIEDNEESRTIIKSYLQPTRANIMELSDGNKIINFLKENDIDLILLDLGLPGKNGYEVLKDIRSYDERVPVIIESALAMPDQKSKAFELGCDDFISKPYNKEDFLNKVDNQI